MGRMKRKQKLKLTQMSITLAWCSKKAFYNITASDQKARCKMPSRNKSFRGWDVGTQTFLQKNPYQKTFMFTVCYAGKTSASNQNRRAPGCFQLSLGRPALKQRCSR